MKPLVQELEVEADYGQIYIYDPQTQLPDEETSEDDDPLQRAMDDAYESRRFVGYASGLVDVVTPSQYNWKAPMRIEVSDTPPASDLEAWDHVVEVSLPVPSGTLVFQSSGGANRSRRRYHPATTAHGSRGAATWPASGRSRATRATGCNCGRPRRLTPSSLGTGADMT